MDRVTTRIGHIGLFCADLEKLREFYGRYFGARSGEKYTNPAKGFQSYLLSFEEDSCRLEIMQKTGVDTEAQRPVLGLAHISLSVGSAERVDAMTEILRADGYTVLGEPRTTGDGFYESVVADPEGNEVEITV